MIHNLQLDKKIIIFTDHQTTHPQINKSINQQINKLTNQQTPGYSCINYMGARHNGQLCLSVTDSCILSVHS